MGDRSTIEWTDASWNIVTGCDRVSEGCDRCYIERTPPFRIEGRRFDQHGRMGIRLHPDRLDWPKRWRKPRLVFTPSLGDLFHKDVPDDFICQVFDAMHDAPQHVYQVLTKRPQRMAAWTQRFYDCDHGGFAGPCGWCKPWSNVWLGTSIESDRYVWRADHLRATPAAVRWLSLEPLLGPLPSLDLTGIGWVVVGGESGPGARPMHPHWVRGIRDACREEGIPFFFKQWGEWRPAAEADGNRIDGHVNLDGTFGTVAEPYYALPGAQMLKRVGKKAAGRVLDGRTWNEYPEPAGTMS